LKTFIADISRNITYLIVTADRTFSILIDAVNALTTERLILDW